MERQAEQLATGLGRSGYEVDVWTRRVHTELPAVEQRPEFRIRRLRPLGMGRLAEYLGPPLWALRLALESHRPILAVFGGGWLALFAALAARHTGRPWILRPATAGDLDRFLDPAAVPAAGPLRKWLRGHLPPASWRASRLREAAAVIAISEEIEAEFARWGFPPARCHRIANGVDTKRFHIQSRERRYALRFELGLPIAAPVVIFLGRLVRRKGLLELVEAWRQLHREGRLPEQAVLVLVGSGKGQVDGIEERLRQEAETLPGLRLVGLSPRPEDWLTACDIICLPSHNEGLSNSLLEAMSSGCAILMSDIGANRAVARPEHEALVHAPGDAAAIARGLGRLLDQPDLGPRLGKAARERAVERFSLEATTRAWSVLLGNVASSTRSPQ